MRVGETERVVILRFSNLFIKKKKRMSSKSIRRLNGRPFVKTVIRFKIDLQSMHFTVFILYKFTDVLTRFPEFHHIVLYYN